MNGSNWNANSGENNVLNASGVALVKKVVGILKKLDEPETHLSETTLTATNASVGADRVSGSVTYKAPEGNTATVTIPDGITLVNETSGKNGTGKVTLVDSTVTDNHNLVQQFGIIFQGHINGRLSGIFNLFRFITDKSKDNNI